MQRRVALSHTLGKNASLTHTHPEQEAISGFACGRYGFIAALQAGACLFIKPLLSWHMTLVQPTDSVGPPTPVHWTQRRWLQALVLVLLGVLAIAHIGKKTKAGSAATPVARVVVCPSPTACVCETATRQGVKGVAGQTEAVERVPVVPKEPPPSCAERANDVERKAYISHLEEQCGLLDVARTPDEKDKALKMCMGFIELSTTLFFEKGTQTLHFCPQTDVARTKSLLERLCLQLHDQTFCGRLGFVDVVSEGALRNPTRGVELLRAACEQKERVRGALRSEIACALVADVLEDPTQAGSGRSEALGYRKQACEKGSGADCLKVVAAADRGELTLSPTERLQWLARSCIKQRGSERKICEEISKLIVDGAWSLHVNPEGDHND